jgi:hypothetical protein
VSSCRSPELGSIPKKIYFRVWPLAKIGSFLLWMMASPPTWQMWRKKPCGHCGCCSSSAGGAVTWLSLLVVKLIRWGV